MSNLTPQTDLDRVARVLVAQTFFGQMFRQMRESPFKSDLLDGGRGGQVFQAQLDQRIAERMSNSGVGERIVQSIVRRFDRTMNKSPYVATDRRA
jgi:Rod binding domain-containing protein